MCIHTSNTKTAKQNEERFEAEFSVPGVYEPYYKLSGYEFQYSEKPRNLFIIRQNNYDQIDPAYWSLVPEHFDLSQRKGWKYHTYNSRADNILSKKTKAANFINNQRCIILADGVFEPHNRGDIKYPCYIKHGDHSLFALAGVYSELDDGLFTASIITVEANPFFAEIHNTLKQGTYRMPLVLDPSDEVNWLSDDLMQGDIESLLYSFTSKEFVSYPVIKERGQPLDSYEGIQPFKYPPKQQQGLF